MAAATRAAAALRRSCLALVSAAADPDPFELEILCKQIDAQAEQLIDRMPGVDARGHLPRGMFRLSAATLPGVADALTRLLRAWSAHDGCAELAHAAAAQVAQAARAVKHEPRLSAKAGATLAAAAARCAALADHQGQRARMYDVALRQELDLDMRDPEALRRAASNMAGTAGIADAERGAGSADTTGSAGSACTADAEVPAQDGV